MKVSLQVSSEKEAAAQEEESKRERKLQVQEKREEAARKKVEAQQRREFKAAKNKLKWILQRFRRPTFRESEVKKRQLEEQEGEEVI